MKPYDKIYLLVKEEVTDTDGYYEVTKTDIIGAFATRAVASECLITNENAYKIAIESKCRERDYSYTGAYRQKNITECVDHDGMKQVTEICWDPDHEYWTKWWIEEMYLQGKDELDACAGTSDHKE